MFRRLCAVVAFSLVAVSASAQGLQMVPAWSNLNLSTYVIPASAVSGGGVTPIPLFGPQSCTVPAYSFTGAPTNGWGGTSTSICGVIASVARTTLTSTSWTTTVPVLAADGSASAPSYSFANNTNAGIYRNSNNSFGFAVNGSERMRWNTATPSVYVDALGFDITNGDVSLSRGAADVLLLASGDKFAFGGVTSSDVMFKQSGTQVQTRLGNDGGFGNFAAGQVWGSAGFYLTGSNVLAISGTAPTVTSAGTSPSVTASNGTAAFRVNVGTGGTATTIVMAMPAATTGWNCDAQNITANAANRANQHVVQQSSTTTAVTVQNQTISTGAALAFTASDIVRFICVAY